MPDDIPELALVQETAVVTKRRVVTGKVRVRTETDDVQRIVADELRRDDVEVTRFPLDRVVEVAPPIRTEGDVTILPVVAEVLVIEKRLMLVEEIHVRRTARRESVEIPVKVRRQRAVVERIDPETGAVLSQSILRQED